ncbi:MAG: hypothetical protein NZT92_03035 [Abditibacteriales bacterium]|nr:hypothetical protein [Abditibacteriales bacterium]
MPATDEAGHPMRVARCTSHFTRNPPPATRNAEAEYAGHDDNGTPEDEGDDHHLYYIRRYKLREVPVPLDNDGDLWENEDPMNGIDDDGDGAVDEDPVDYQPLRGHRRASFGCMTWRSCRSWRSGQSLVCYVWSMARTMGCSPARKGCSIRCWCGCR